MKGERNNYNATTMFYASFLNSVEIRILASLFFFLRRAFVNFESFCARMSVRFKIKKKLRVSAHTGCSQNTLALDRSKSNFELVTVSKIFSDLTLITADKNC